MGNGNTFGATHAIALVDWGIVSGTQRTSVRRARRIVRSRCLAVHVYADTGTGRQYYGHFYCHFNRLDECAFWCRRNDPYDGSHFNVYRRLVDHFVATALSFVTTGGISQLQDRTGVSADEHTYLHWNHSRVAGLAAAFGLCSVYTYLRRLTAVDSHF